MTELLDEIPVFSEGELIRNFLRGCADGSPPLEWRLPGGPELVGESKNSAMAERRRLVRREDGQVIQLSPLVYAIASCLDGGAKFSTRSTRPPAPEAGVRSVRKTSSTSSRRNSCRSGWSGPPRPSRDGAKPPHRGRCSPCVFGSGLPERVHRHISTTLRPLFRLPVVVLVLAR